MRQEAHHLPVAPRYPLFPLIERQALTTLTLNVGDKIRRPRIELPPLRAHPGIGWPHLLGVRGYPPSGIEIDGFEGADNRPAQSKAVANDAVDVVDGGDAVADETVRLAEQRPLQP